MKGTSLLLVAAIGADSVKFHLVPSELTPSSRATIFCIRSRSSIFELDNTAASLADKMIVMLLADRFVARLAFVEMALGKQFAFLEQPQGSVNRRVADVRIDFLDFRVQKLGADMLPAARRIPARYRRARRSSCVRDP